MQPSYSGKNPFFPKANTFKLSGINQQQGRQRQTRFPRSRDIDRQTQQLKALKLYGMNNQFRQLMFSGQQLTVEKCLSKYTFYSETIEKLSRRKLKIVKCGKGVMYLGEVFNDKCHGKGIVVFQDGRLYEGQLQNNVRQGEGLYVQSDGSWYFGEFSNDKKDGSGVEIHKSYRYKGVYINGLKHGVGFMVTDNIIYSGEWRLGAIHGYGYVQTPQSLYQGTFDKFLKHGEGIEYFRNGDVYKGSYINGKPEGEGHYTWSDKSNFQGQFKNGKRNGNGVWKSPIGDQYIGAYQNDTKHGEGQFYWKSGNVYKGGFAQDKREGYGEMFWNDGSYYKGLWTKGIQNGKGELFLPPNKTYTGIFENNVLIISEPLKPNRPMTEKQKFKRQRIPIMSAAKPVNPFTYFNPDKELAQTQRKKPRKQKQLSPLDHMSAHHRNCPACFQKAKQATQKFQAQRVSKSQVRRKSESYYVPQSNHVHNHSVREAPDDIRSFHAKQYPQIPSRMEFSIGQPATIDSQQLQSKDRSPFRYLRFKFT